MPPNQLNPPLVPQSDRKWACIPRKVERVGNGTMNMVVDFRSPDGRVITKELNLHSDAFPDSTTVENLLKQQVRDLNQFEIQSAKFTSLIDKEIVE